MIIKLCSLASVLVVLISSGYFYNENAQGVSTPKTSMPSVTASPEPSRDSDITSQNSGSATASFEGSSQTFPVFRVEKTVFETLYPSFSPNVKTIPLDVINSESTDLGIGNNIYLQYFQDGKWSDLPQLSLPENVHPVNPAISPPFIMANSRVRLSAPLASRYCVDYPRYDLPLKEGTYRLIDDFDNISNSFKITSQPSEWQSRIIEKINSISAFEDMPIAPHDFTVPFTYQGLISDDKTSGIKLSVFILPDLNESVALFQSIKEDGYLIPQLYRANDGFQFGEDKRYNWEDTPHFYFDGMVIYLYCGDDETILKAMEHFIKQGRH